MTHDFSNTHPVFQAVFDRTFGLHMDALRIMPYDTDRYILTIRILALEGLPELHIICDQRVGVGQDQYELDLKGDYSIRLIHPIQSLLNSAPSRGVCEMYGSFRISSHGRPLDPQFRYALHHFDELERIIRHPQSIELHPYRQDFTQLTLKDKLELRLESHEMGYCEAFLGEHEEVLLPRHNGAPVGVVIH